MQLPQTGPDTDRVNASNLQVVGGVGKSQPSIVVQKVPRRHSNVGDEQSYLAVVDQKKPHMAGSGSGGIRARESRGAIMALARASSVLLTTHLWKRFTHTMLAITPGSVNSRNRSSGLNRVLQGWAQKSQEW